MGKEWADARLHTHSRPKAEKWYNIWSAIRDESGGLLKPVGYPPNRRQAIVPVVRDSQPVHSKYKDIRRLTRSYDKGAFFVSEVRIRLIEGI